MSMAIIGVAGAAVAVGAGAYSASQSGPAPAPGPKSLASSTTQGRALYGGQNYWLDQQQAHNYAGLNSDLASSGLFGRGAQTTDVPYQTWDPKAQRWVTRTRAMMQPAQEGLLSMMGRAQPQIQALQRAGDPTGYAALDKLTADASSMIGGNSPYEDHLVQQDVRQAQAARGMGLGNTDAFNEALQLELSRQQRRQQAGQYAGGVLSVRRGYMGDPTADAVRYIGAGQSLGGGQIAPTSPWNPQVAQSQQAAYLANLSNFNSGVNNIAAMGSGLSQMAQRYQQPTSGPGYGPGNNYYSDPAAMASMPYR